MHHFDERYNRQLILKGFGPAAQEALAAARVLVIGAGGLGCPALLYLTAAGVGTIGIVDHDTISLSNLHRQVLYTTDDIGLLKTEVAARKLGSVNPLVKIISYPFQLDNLNAAELFSQFDYVIDGSDNFPTRYLVNDACTLSGKPLIYGAVSEYEGQVAIFNVGEPATRTNYRDLFPIQPADDEFRNCAEAGVLGVLPGIIGTMQATELIKLVTGIGEPLVNRLLTYNALTQEIFTVDLQLPTERNYTLPQTAQELALIDYGAACITGIGVEEISIEQLASLASSGDAVIIDVREENETPPLPGYQYVQIPLSVFPLFAEGIEGDPVILFCQKGGRSLKAAELLKEVSKQGRRIYSLSGGVAGNQNARPDHCSAL